MALASEVGSAVTLRSLSTDEVATYRRQGVMHLPSLVDAATVERMLAACDERMRNPGKYGANLSSDGVFFQDREMYRDHPAFEDFVMHSRMAELAAQAMGARQVQFYFDHLFALGPNSARDQYYWHQDQPYWAVAGEQVCSFWLALTDCAADSGALEFVSHSDRGPLYLPNRFGDRSTIEESDSEAPPAYHEARDRYDILTWDIAAGDALLFNARIMHSSRGNHSRTQRRIAYSTRWIGDDATFARKPGFQDPVTCPEEGFPVGEKMARSKKFPILWRA